MALVGQAKEDGESDERDADDDGEEPKPVFLDVLIPATSSSIPMIAADTMTMNPMAMPPCVV